jgi:hypothetical protein
MSAIATPAATPPRAVAPEGGRLKRKAKVPERFQSPPPAKRVRVHPPARAKKPGNGEKHVAAAKTTSRAGKGGKPPRAPAQRHHAYDTPVAPADTGVNAMALAALSSPSAAALLGQSPVPEAVAERAMRDAANALAADRTGGLAGLALLLAASSGSPFRADLALAEGQCLSKGYKTKGRVAPEATREVAAPRAAANGWGAQARRRRSAQNEASDDAKATFVEAAKAVIAKPSLPPVASKQRSGPDSKGKGTKSAPLKAEHAAPTSDLGAFGFGLENCESAASALARGDAAAPAAILKHALRWMDLVVADLKGRAAALRRSRRRLQKVKQDTEMAQAARSNSAEATLEEEKTLLRDLDRALAAESRGVDAQLRAAAELRALAAGDRAKAMRAFEAAAAAEKNATGDDDDGSAGVARGRGRPKGPAGGEKAVVGSRFAAITATLRGESLGGGASEPAGEVFARCSLAMAEAFLKTGLDAAAAERAGDAETAATAACPANLTPAPHVPRLFLATA